MLSGWSSILTFHTFCVLIKWNQKYMTNGGFIPIMVDEVMTVYKALPETLEEDFGKIYEQAVRMVNEIEIEPAKSQAAGRPKHRANAPSETVKECNLVNMAIPFLVHIILEFGAQFTGLSVRASKLFGIIPSILCGEKVPEGVWSSRCTKINCFHGSRTEVLEHDLATVIWQIKHLECIPTSFAQANKVLDVGCTQISPNSLIFFVFCISHFMKV